MAIGLPENQGFVFVSKEDAVGPNSPAGTYKAPVAGEAVQVLSDGLEFTPGQETVERDIRTPTLEERVGRTTTRSITGTVPVEFRANTAEGGAPEADKLYEGLFGGKRQRTDTTLQTAASQTGVNSADRKNTFAVAAGDTAKFRVGDAVRIFKDGVIDFVSVVKAVDSTANEIELVSNAPVDIPGDSDVSPCTTYFVDPNRSDFRYLSITELLGGRVEQRAIGCRPTTLELSNFSTGQLPQCSFGLEGLDFDRQNRTDQQLSALRALINYQQSLPPIILDAHVYQGDKELILNNISISITNTLGFTMSTSSERGKLGSRVTGFECTFTMNPYMDDANVDAFELFRNNNSFSLFGYAANKDAAGKLSQICSFYMPNCRVREISTGNEDGILTNELTGTAYLENRNDTVFFSFI